MLRFPASLVFRRLCLTGVLLLTGAAVALAGPATTLLVSKGYDGGQAVTSASLRGWGGSASMSADGRYVVFVSNAQNIAPGADGKYQVFLRDRVADTVQVVSRSTGGAVGDRDSRDAVLSADGRFVVFSSSADNLVLGDSNGTDVFVRDLTAGVTQRVSVGADGAEGDNWSDGRLAISASGRYVAFSSAAGTLTPAGWTGHVQVYLRDLLQNTIEMVSVNSEGAPANQDGYFDHLSISADGRYVAFGSTATNLVSGDTNDANDIFVRDRVSHTTSRVNVTANVAQANGYSRDAVISADGRYVAFASDAPNLAGVEQYAQQQVYVRDLQTGALELVSATAGEPAWGGSGVPALSADGRYVAFSSNAELTPGGGGRMNVYLRDRTTAATTRVSEALGGGSANADQNSWPETPTVSDDGRCVLFMSSATNLIAGDVNGRTDVFVRDRAESVTQRANDGPNSLAAVAPAYCSGSSISADGRYVAYLSDATNLVPGDTNGFIDAFVWNRLSGVTERVSVSTSGAEANADVESAVVSADGRYVAFVSRASNLVAGDVNESSDVFLRDRMLGTTERVSLSNAGALLFGVSYFMVPAVSADGRYVAFAAFGGGIAPGDTPQTSAYVRDRWLGSTECVSGAYNGDPADGGLSPYGFALSMSADGRYVAFVSDATNVTPGDTNGLADVFVRDRTGHATERVSLSGSVQPDRISLSPMLSADGRYVAFVSYATNLVQPKLEGYSRVYVRDRALGALEIETLDPFGNPVYYGGSSPGISADGRWVSFDSFDNGLVAGDTNWAADVFLRSRAGRTTERVSVAADGSQARAYERGSDQGSVSGAGRFVSFSSNAPNLTDDAPGGGRSIFLRDRGGSGGAPTAPANLSGSITAPLQARLEWADRSNNEALFRIERSADGGETWSAIGAAGANVTVYVDATLAPGASYQYRVRAANEDGDSAPTAAVFISTGPNVPGKPSGLAVTALGAASLRLTWTDGSLDETSFRIERKTGAGSFAQVGTTDSNITTYTDANLGANVTYTYRVRAHNADGDSDFSDNASAATPPLPPASITATAPEPRRVELHWTDPNAAPASVTIERSATSGGPWGAPVSVTAGTTAWADTSVQPFTTYFYRLRAMGPGGNSAYADQVNVSTPLEPPAAPADLKATVLSDTQIRLDWTYSGPPVAGFNIERKSGAGNFTAVASISAAPYLDHSLSPNTTYTYRVRAYVAGMESAASNSAVAATWPTPHGKLIAPKSLNYGAVRLGSSKILTLTLRNGSRTDALAIFGADVLPPFSVAAGAPPVLIPPGGSKTLTVRFTPAQKGSARTWLTLNTSDSASGARRVELRGAGK